MTLTAVDPAAIALPVGYRARAFRDEDREPLVAIGNAELPEAEQQSANDWRAWEQMAEDLTLTRFVVERGGGEIVGMLSVSNGGPFRAPDGSARGGINVARPHRGKGIGSALLPVLEAEARRLGAPKLHASLSARVPEALPWAEKRGYKEIGRRIQAAIDLDRFDPARWADRVNRVTNAGIRIVPLDELRGSMDATAFEDLLHRVHDAEGEAWADVPLATPMPHWAFDVFRRLMLEGPGSAPDLHLIAFDGENVVGLTSSYRSEGGKKGGTGFTGTLRAYRGRGIAFALKADVLTRAKASGIRWMLTTNDEPNKPMRGINYALGYEPLPPNIQLEKTL